MPDPVPAESPPKPEQPQEAAPPRETYTLKFEPLDDFTEAALYTIGAVRGKIWVSPNLSLTMRSLSSKEVDSINDAVRIKDGMTVSHYNTETMYHSLARSIEKIGDKQFEGSVEDKIDKLRGMAAPVVTRFSLAYIEFNGRVDGLFAGKEGLETAKKS